MHRIIGLFLLLTSLCLAQDSIPLASFPKVKMLGNLQPDRGWVLKELKVDGRSFSASDHLKGGQAALRSQGWEQAAPGRRSKLALDWCTQAELFGQSVLRQKPEDFPAGQKFSPPVSRIDKNGVIRVEVWWASLSGNVALPAGLYYHRTRWEFQKDARIREIR